MIQSHLFLSSYAGCQLLAELMEETGFRREARRLGVKRIKLGFSDAEYVQLFVMLLATGHSDFEAVRELRRDSVIRHLLGLKKLPHANTLREYLGRMTSGHIAGLKRLMLHPLRFVEPLADPIGMIPVDVDDSVFEQHGEKKENAAWAYNGEFGYRPLFMFIGRDGWLLDGLLRPGNTNGVQDADLLIEKAFDRLPEDIQGKPLLYRLDRGFYSGEVAKMIRLLGKDFIIKARQTPRLKAVIAAIPEESWTDAEGLGPKAPPTRYAEFTWQPFGWKEPCRFIVRREVHHGDELFPEVRDFVYATSLDHAPQDIDACYRRRGMAENYIKELQYTLDLECLPSGDFATNQAFLHMGMITYNLLVLLAEMHQDPKLTERYKSGRMTLKTVRRKLLHVAGYIVNHARKLSLALSRSFVLLDEYKQTLARIRTMTAIHDPPDYVPV
ncbi:MAG: IS1380 family transposase [Mariprofundaceae bacterium]